MNLTSYQQFRTITNKKNKGKSPYLMVDIVLFYWFFLGFNSTEKLTFTSSPSTPG